MNDIQITKVTNGFIVTDEASFSGRIPDKWVFGTMAELQAFIANHFEPATKEPESPCGADALIGISGSQRKVIYPISVKVTDQDGNYSAVRWTCDQNQPVRIIPGSYRQEVNLPNQHGSCLPVQITDDKPESDLSDITASVIKRQGL